MARPPESRYLGCLIGQCVGDAVGFMVEGYPPGPCRQYADGVLLRGQDFTGRRGPHALGQYSDDSQLARELMASCVACRGFDPADYARRIAAIFAEGRIVGYGQATAAAAERLAAGVPWDQAGTPPPSAGNGSAMRAGPIGLIYRHDGGALIAAARDQGRITHADPRCSAGAVAIAGAVALACESTVIEPGAFLDRLAGAASEIEPVLAGVLGALAGWLDWPPERAAPVISAAGAPDLGGGGDAGDGISPYVVPSVAWSLYAFLRHPEDYVRAIHTAVAVGGDVDTTAAMTGAIAGARGGIEAVPPALVARLTDRGTWEAGALAALARDAWRMAEDA